MIHFQQNAGLRLCVRGVKNTSENGAKHLGVLKQITNVITKSLIDTNLMLQSGLSIAHN